MDEGIKKFIEFNQTISRLSNDEIIQQYLKFIHEISETKKLPFLLEGNIQWKSKSSYGIIKDDIWLVSKLHDPVGKHILDSPVRNFLQTQMNHYEIGGTFDLNIDSNDLEYAKNEITRVLNEITILKNSFSLLHGVSIDWTPARYLQLGFADISPPPQKPPENKKEYQFLRLPKSQESQISSIFDDNHISNILLFTKILTQIDEPIKTILKTSMDWHADGNKLRSGLSRFISFWASIELLGEYFYKNLDSDLVGRKTKSEKKKQIFEILSGDITKDKKILQKISQCNSIVLPPIKEKICSVLPIICGQDDWEKILFEGDEGNKSFYQIRNDIAHGSISEHHFENVSSLNKKLIDINRISRRIILATVGNTELLKVII
jgi:hypothetical protein